MASTLRFIGESPWLVWSIPAIVLAILLWITWKDARKAPHGAEGTVRAKPAAKPADIDPDVAIDLSEWTRYFDRLFDIQMNTLLFRRLWNNAGTNPNPDPSISLNLVVKNNTPLHVHIIDVDGRAKIDGDEAPQSARMETAGDVRVDPWTQITPTVMQPLSAARGLDMISKIETGEPIRISSGSIKLSFRVEEKVADPLPKSIGVSFEVDPTGITSEDSGLSCGAMVMKHP